MPQEALDKGGGLKLGHLDAIALLTVAQGEANLIALQVQETVVGNGHAMGIATERVQGRLRPAKRGLGVDDPLLLAQSLDEGVKGRLRLKHQGGLGEAQRVLGVEWVQCVEIFSAKDGAQGLDGKEALGRRGLPSLALVGQRPSRNSSVQVEMGVQALIPGV